MALRFGRIQNEEEWKEMKPNMKAINKNYKKRKGMIMFPTSHDITLESVDNYIIVLKKLLKVRNNVLITTKAKQKCISKIYREIFKENKKYKSQVEFRITIGSNDNNILNIYEKNAPSLYERLFNLSALSLNGFKTSVSIEPFLDKNPIDLIKNICEFMSFKGTIWLGSMSGKVPDELKENYTIENLRKIVSEINKLPEEIKSKIQYKDSIRYKLNL